MDAAARDDATAHSILVLGATGSCGRHFVEHAIHAGFNVRCLTRDPDRVKSEVRGLNPAFNWASHASVELRLGNLTDEQVVADACIGVSSDRPPQRRQVQ